MKLKVKWRVKHFVTDGSAVEESIGCRRRSGSCKSSGVLALVSLVVVVVLSIDFTGFLSLTWKHGTKSFQEVSHRPLEAFFYQSCDHVTY